MPAIIISVTVLLAALLMGCQTLVTQEHPAENWQYQIKADRVGEKRGIPWGYLFYKGRELKSYFSTLVISDTRYDFTINTEESDFGGYRVNKEYTDQSSQATERIGEEEMKKGWYLAGLEQRKLSTPDYWIWVKRQNVEAFLDPSSIYSFLKKYNISAIVGGDKEEPSIGLRVGFGFRSKL
jgi:hypothetical protein